jgi:hypothetical protein
MLIIGCLTFVISACKGVTFSNAESSKGLPNNENASQDPASCLVNLATSQAPERDHLQAYLRFEGGLNDSSGNALSVSEIGGVQLATNAPDWNSGVVALDGVDDWVNVGLDINAMSELTVSMWTRISKVADGSSMMFFGNDDGNFDFGLSMSSDQSGWFWYPHLGSEDGSSSTGVEAMSPGPWHHVAIVYASDDVRVFKDGQQVWNLGYAPASPSGTDYLSIGRSNYQGFGDGHSYLSAYVDEFAVWNRALTSSQISQISSRVVCP